MELKFPSFSEYQSALQHPRICFRHYPLNQGEIEQDLWGLPRVRSGGFALTYKLTGHSRSLAVRCFYRSIPDRMQRYYEISRFIEACGSSALIPVRYLSRGIHVQGRFYPVTYMDWVEGMTLDEWLVKNHARSAKVLAFGEEFLRLAAELETLGVAHGDLSHRNILYDGRRAVLIDYDGMFVPALRGKRACELGNPYFQHPGRKKEFFNAEVDRFSEIAIYLALTAIALRPELYTLFETGGEGLLFAKKDFQNPYTSAVMREIEQIPELRVMIQQFREICLGDIAETPRLEDFIHARAFVPVRSEPVTAAEEDDQAAHPAFLAEERKDILLREGQLLQIVGQVTEVHRGRRAEGQPHVFVNFGSWRRKCFTIVLWDEPLRDYLENYGDPEALTGKWVSVNGLVTSYNYRPQISLTSLSEMSVLQGRKDAEVRLGKVMETGSETSGIGLPHDFNLNIPVPQPNVANQSPLEHMGEKSSLDRSVEVIQRIDQLFKKS